MTVRAWLKPLATVCGAAGLALSFSAAAAIPADNPDPDFQAVQAVCGRCHSTELFQDKPRSWERWNDVFADMTQRGAAGTEEQLVRVTRYFLENLTLLNVNSSPAEELTGVLGVTEDVAQSIIARRERRPFANLADLRGVAGINAAILEKRKARILF